MGVPSDPLVPLENGTRIVKVGHTCQAGLNTPLKPHPRLVARTSLTRHNNVHRPSAAGLGVLTQSEEKCADLVLRRNTGKFAIKIMVTNDMDFVAKCG